jgi:hypothetical protein
MPFFLLVYLVFLQMALSSLTSTRVLDTSAAVFICKDLGSKHSLRLRRNHGVLQVYMRGLGTERQNTDYQDSFVFVMKLGLVVSPSYTKRGELSHIGANAIPQIVTIVEKSEMKNLEL